MSWQGFKVTERIDRASARLGDAYPLLPGDLLTKDPDGSWRKEAPGICVGGFRLTPEQEATLRPVLFTVNGLNYTVEDE